MHKILLNKDTDTVKNSKYHNFIGFWRIIVYSLENFQIMPFLCTSFEHSLSGHYSFIDSYIQQIFIDHLLWLSFQLSGWEDRNSQ